VAASLDIPPAPRAPARTRVTMSHPALLAFFLPLTRRTCAELGIGDDVVARHLAGVLSEFARTDRLYRLRAPDGRKLTSVVEMLGMGPDDRYVGDFALFMSGLFRPFVARGGYLGYYLDEGARAYARATARPALARGERALYDELARRFEYYAGALDYLRKVRFPGLSDADPVRAFARDIDGVLRGMSRN
jgi:hypothetical protein